MLIGFIAMVISMGYLVIDGHKNGDRARLMAPTDADKKFCGFDDLVDYKYMYFTSMKSINPITIMQSGVCVKKCPSEPK